MEKEELVECLGKKEQRLENDLSESNVKFQLLEESYDQLEKDKFEIANKLSMCKTQVENIQDLYSESTKLQVNHYFFIGYCEELFFSFRINILKN